MKRILNFFLAAAVSITAFSCMTDDNPGMARLTVKLVDAPGDYDSVFIDIQDVEFKFESDSVDFGTGNVNPGIYNLLELTGGAHVVLADNMIPEGRLEQIRLILGDQNTVVVDSVSHPLKTPSAQQSGLKLNIHEDLEGGFAYDLILDFDVDKSIVQTGNGQYILKPVIHSSMEASSGGITGVVNPDDCQTLVSAISSAQDTVSAFTDSEGVFFLHGLDPDSYTVTIEPDEACGYDDITLSNVDVQTGQITDLGTIDLDDSGDGDGDGDGDGNGGD